MVNFILYLWQEFYYGILRRRPAIDFSDIPSSINLVGHFDEKNRVHWVESPDLPEFYASGKTKEDLAKNIFDTILVYFDVPTYFAKRMKDGVLHLNNAKKGTKEIIQVDREAIDRVLA